MGSENPLHPSLGSENPLHPSLGSEYPLHPSRWPLLASVILLNLANYAHWVAFPGIQQRLHLHP